MDGRTKRWINVLNRVAYTEPVICLLDSSDSAWQLQYFLRTQGPGRGWSPWSFDDCDRGCCRCFIMRLYHLSHSTRPTWNVTPRSQGGASSSGGIRSQSLPKKIYRHKWKCESHWKNAPSIPSPGTSSSYMELEAAPNPSGRSWKRRRSGQIHNYGAAASPGKGWHCWHMPGMWKGSTLPLAP